MPVPEEFSAVADSSTEIKLSWGVNNFNGLAQNIAVQRWNPTNSVWTEITDVPVSSFYYNYTDSGLNPETNYRYRIACLDTNGNISNFSEVENATTLTVVPNYAVTDISASLASVLTNFAPSGNLLTNSSLAQFDLRRTIPLDSSHAASVLGTNASAFSQAVARFNEQWPQIQLDLDPVLLSPHSILPRVGYLTGAGRFRCNCLF